MNKNLLPIAAAVMLALGGCGGGGGSSSTSSGGGSGGSTNSDGEVLSSIVSGIEIPTEISAVPASSANGSGKAINKMVSFSGAIRAMAASVSELSSDSDYAKAIPSVYVEERSLEQFDIIETVFGALEQTHYADSANVNQGPYKAMIAWEEDQNGKDVKTLETWTVESRMIVVENLPSDVTGNTTGDTNKLYAWIPEIDRETGEEVLVKAEFLIYTAPDKADDGSLLNYGEWDMNVLMNASSTGVDTIPNGGPDGFFAASARIGSNGTSVLQVHDKFTEEMGDGQAGGMVLSEEMKGILVRDGANGYGQVSYPDWEACWRNDPNSNSNPCENGVPTNVAKYAYNGNYLGVQEVNDNVAGDAVYKDRNLDGAIRVVHRYALFHADADTQAGIAEGDDAEKHLSFGFPVSYERAVEGQGGGTFNEFAYYGAWQGRHQLWGPGGITPTTNGTDGTTLTRQDVRPGVTPPTYKLKEFDGTFTMRALVDADLADIQNIAVETWLNDHFDLFYKVDPDNNVNTNDDDWYFCEGYIDWGGMEPVCTDKATNNPTQFTALTGSALLGQLNVASGDRRWVNIGACDNNGCTQYMYLAGDPGNGFDFSGGAGFYQADWGNEGQMVPVSPANKLTPADGMNMWVDIGGSIYVAYTGDFDGPDTTTGWVTKTLESFDEQTWTPTFAENGDSEFTPERGVEYYMNAKGQNYIVKRIADATTSAAAYVARLELQTAANPGNTDSANSESILPTATSYLAAPWNTDVKYTLVEDSSDSNYLLLEVVSDETGTSSTGDLGTDDIWGLVAFNSSDQPLAADGTALIVDEWGWIDPQANNGVEPVQFNYEYAGTDGDNWGKQQFLVAMTDDSYVILSDPITLNNVALYDNLGNASGETVSIQFDGWMHGLPDMYFELQKNNWSIQGLGDKVRRLLEGQAVSDSQGTNYFVKPMEMSLFLGEVNAFPNGDGQPDISAADAVNLNGVPDYVHHEMGAAPTTNADGDPIEVKYSEGQPLE